MSTNTGVSCREGVIERFVMLRRRRGVSRPLGSYRPPRPLKSLRQIILVQQGLQYLASR